MFGQIIGHVKTVVIGILVIIIMAQRCDHGKREDISIDYLPKQEINIKREYVPQILYVKGKETIFPLYKTIVKHDSVFVTEDVDTTAILLQYLSTVHVDDTIQNDSIAYIIVSDDISQNRIVKRTVAIKVYPLIKPIKPRRKVYAGLSIGGGINRFTFGGTMLYQDRRDNIYGISYYPIERIVMVSVYWKIKFKKLTN